MRPEFHLISQQIASLQKTLNLMMLQDEARPAVLMDADGDQELSDDDLFAILRSQGLPAYKKALQRRNKQRLARMKRYGHL